jgi:hypothetical protein
MTESVGNKSEFDKIRATDTYITRESIKNKT